MDNLTHYLSHLLQPPYVYLSGAALALLAGLYLVHGYRRSHRAIVPFKTQGGTIEISPNTLRAVIQIAVASVPGVERAACRHFPRGQGVGIRLAIHLRANHPLREVETGIKRRIRATLMEQFGMDAVDPIHIRVTRMIGDPLAARDDASPKGRRGEEYTDEPDSARESDDDRPYADETRV